mgnify:CR=1 FL=1
MFTYYMTGSTMFTYYKQHIIMFFYLTPLVKNPVDVWNEIFLVSWHFVCQVTLYRKHLGLS